MNDIDKLIEDELEKCRRMLVDNIEKDPDAWDGDVSADQLVPTAAAVKAMLSVLPSDVSLDHQIKNAIAKAMLGPVPGLDFSLTKLKESSSEGEA